MSLESKLEILTVAGRCKKKKAERKISEKATRGHLEKEGDCTSRELTE